MKVNFIYQLTGILDAGLCDHTVDFVVFFNKSRSLGNNTNMKLKKEHQSETNHGIGVANPSCGFFAMNLTSKR